MAPARERHRPVHVGVGDQPAGPPALLRAVDRIVVADLVVVARKRDYRNSRALQPLQLADDLVPPGKPAGGGFQRDPHDEDQVDAVRQRPVDGGGKPHVPSLRRLSAASFHGGRYPRCRSARCKMRIKSSSSPGTLDSLRRGRCLPPWPERETGKKEEPERRSGRWRRPGGGLGRGRPRDDRDRGGRMPWKAGANPSPSPMLRSGWFPTTPSTRPTRSTSGFRTNPALMAGGVSPADRRASPSRASPASSVPNCGWWWAQRTTWNPVLRQVAHVVRKTNLELDLVDEM